MSERAQTWKSAVYAGLMFGLISTPIAGFFSGMFPPHSGGDAVALLAQGLIAAVGFGLIMGLFVRSKTVARQTAIELPDGEAVEFEGNANHFLNGEGRGGRLYLTNRNLIFQPHRFNLQSTRVVIPRADIAGAAKCRTWGIFPNGLLVTHRDHGMDRFVIAGDRQEWVRRMAA